MNSPGFIHTLRVRYEETDQMGVAHHGSYVTWLEEARIEWLRSVGLSYRKMEEKGILMPVYDLQIRYRSSLRFDDPVEIHLDAHQLGRCRVHFDGTIYSEGDLKAESEVTVVVMGPEGRPMRLPNYIVEAFREAGYDGRQSPTG